MGDDTSFIKVGTSEVFGGESWDEKGMTKISRILITYGPCTIKSLQFQYVKDGKMLLSELHGKHGSNFVMLTLDHKSEYITGVTGLAVISKSCTPKGRRRVVSSITIETNVKKYGPFGNTGDDNYPYHSLVGKFSFQFGPGNHFGGFHGNFGKDYLESIGVYVKTTLA